jgi:hypothetical protein
MIRKREQLYSYIDKFSTNIRDESTLGLVTGYAITSGLLDFHPLNLEGREPRSFKEIWTVYDSLKDAIYSTGTEQQTYTFLSTLKPKVKNKIKLLTTPIQSEVQSELLELLLRSIKGSSLPLEELLKEKGLKISQEVLNKGYLTYARNRVFDEDYRLIRNAFSKQ